MATGFLDRSNSGLQQSSKWVYFWTRILPMGGGQWNLPPEQTYPSAYGGPAPSWKVQLHKWPPHPQHSQANSSMQMSQMTHLESQSRSFTNLRKLNRDHWDHIVRIVGIIRNGDFSLVHPKLFLMSLICTIQRPCANYPSNSVANASTMRRPLHTLLLTCTTVYIITWKCTTWRRPKPRSVLETTNWRDSLDRLGGTRVQTSKTSFLALC